MVRALTIMTFRAVASGGAVGALAPPQFLAEQFTLSQPGGRLYPTQYYESPPDFQTLRRACGFIYQYGDFAT